MKKTWLEVFHRAQCIATTKRGAQCRMVPIWITKDKRPYCSTHAMRLFQNGEE